MEIYSILHHRTFPYELKEMPESISIYGSARGTGTMGGFIGLQENLTEPIRPAFIARHHVTRHEARGDARFQ